MVLDALVFHDDLVFLGELLQLDDDLAGMHHVDDEHTEEHANEEGKRQIVGQPRQGVENVGMNQEIIGRPKHRPEEGEQRADDSLNVAPKIRIVPQPDFQIFQAGKTRDVLDQRHGDSHGKKQRHPVPDGIRDQVQILQRRQQEQRTQAEAVNRQIRAGAEAGVDPLFVAVGQVAVQQLQHPSEARADKEQKRKYQTKPHKDSPFSILFPVYSFFLNTNETILYETVNTLKTGAQYWHILSNLLLAVSPRFDYNSCNQKSQYSHYFAFWDGLCPRAHTRRILCLKRTRRTVIS